MTSGQNKAARLPEPGTATASFIAGVKWRSYVCAIAEPVRVSFGGMTRRQTMVIAVRSGCGLTGIGETWVNYPRWALDERAGALREGLAPAIMGLPLDDHDLVMTTARKAVFPYARQAGAMGPAHSLLCGLEIALMDIRAQQRGVPLGKLFANDLAPVPVYASGLDTGASLKRVHALIAAGHTTVKFKCGFDFDSDLVALRRFRDVLGPDIAIMVDANQAYSREQALRFADACADLNFLWFEEPIDCTDLDGMAWLRARSPIPIAAGENWYGLEGLSRALDAGAVDIVQPDLIKNATMSEALALSRRASRDGVRMTFHNFSSVLNALTAIHLAAGAIPEAFVELDATGSPITDNFIAPALILDRGTIRPPDSPGLGASITMAPVSEEEASA